jgi:malate dehydrogenase (oxaloacetate-decarboxylating)(NADP+)
MEFDGPANVLICPNLASANIAYKLLEQLGEAEMTGPILSGMNKPVQVVARSDGVRHIVNMSAICVMDVLRKESYWSTISSDDSED